MLLSYDRNTKYFSLLVKSFENHDFDWSTVVFFGTFVKRENAWLVKNSFEFIYYKFLILGVSSNEQ